MIDGNSREKLESFNFKAALLKSASKVLLGDVRRNVGEMKSGARRVDIHVVFGAGLLEPMQRRLRVVFGQPGIRLALLRHLHIVMLRRRHPNLLIVPSHLVQMLNG